MTRDEVQGKVDRLKGQVKPGVSDLTNDPQLHDEGAPAKAGFRPSACVVSRPLLYLQGSGWL